MPKTEAKKGDIVFIDGWDGVIGRVYRVEEDTIWLEWPEGLSPYSFCNPQSFATFAEPEKTVLDKVRVLSANEVFEKMAGLLADKMDVMRAHAADSVKNALSEIPPYTPTKSRKSYRKL